MSLSAEGELTSVAVWLMMWQSVIGNAAAGPEKNSSWKTEIEQRNAFKRKTFIIIIIIALIEMKYLFFMSVLVYNR